MNCDFLDFIRIIIYYLIILPFEVIRNSFPIYINNMRFSRYLFNALGQSEIFLKGSNFPKMLSRHLPPLKTMISRTITVFPLPKCCKLALLQGCYVSHKDFRGMWRVITLFSPGNFCPFQGWYFPFSVNALQVFSFINDLPGGTPPSYAEFILLPAR